MIEIFDDRVVITNPGGLPKGLNKSNFGKISIARNPVIASLLQRSEYIEKMGTGIARMKNAMVEAKLPEPEFATDGFFIVSFVRESFFNNIPLTPQDTPQVTTQDTPQANGVDDERTINIILGRKVPFITR